MKRLISTAVGWLLVLLIQAQVPNVQFIDSLADKTKPNQTILLFTEIRDTTDGQTGKIYTQRNSYYFDWGHKELRYIEVYDFDKVVKRHATERAFRKKKHIPPATRITYTFFENKVVKVKLTASRKQCECEECVEEYYFANDMLISQKKKNSCGQEKNLIDESRSYLTRLQIANETHDLVY